MQLTLARLTPLSLQRFSEVLRLDTALCEVGKRLLQCAEQKQIRLLNLPFRVFYSNVDRKQLRGLIHALL